MRENASIRMATYQQRAAAHYNHKAQPRVFKVGTLATGKFSKTPSKRGPGSSKQIGKALTLSLKQTKTELIIYKS